MLPHSIFDHRLVGSDDKRRFRNKQEQPDGFECLDRCRGKTAIEVVNQYDELFDFCLIEEVLEVLAELMNRVGQVILILCRFQKTGDFFEFSRYFAPLDIGYILPKPSQGPHRCLDLICRRQAGQHIEGHSTASLGDL